ncbi:MAG: molybdopterin-dependent oxidoreductase [Candidatus Tectomicrobia bacterium]|uniref:Molybdopterin-dependent oxidoreductase n=1 Tax=Tectimicrobiota bacterium TaxID=2528274 RepID=A0A932GPY2_UNCTE|nr:molybdopterin-dependent oxidoreductase [Candidatus Tectomicrobia bacterium]
MMTLEEVIEREGYSVIGRPTPKKDGWIKATGEAKFADDLYFPGMLHGKLLRSPLPHARILHIDTSRAEKLPGVRGVVTAKDFPGILYGDFAHTRDYLPLAQDRVRYIGEEVAAVAATDMDTAEEALDLICVEYEPLPAVFSPEEAMQPEAPQLYDRAPNNIASKSEFHYGDVEKGLAESDYVREDTFETQSMKQGMLEPHACVGLWEGSGKITLWSCKSSPYVVWRHLAMGLGVDPGNIRVIQTYIGGSFSGGKQEGMPMDFCAVILSKKTGRPVKFVHTMDEVLVIGHMRHSMKIRLKTGVKRDGTLVAQHCRIIANGGAHASIGQLSIFLPGLGLNLPYRVPNVQMESYRIYTNTGFAGALRSHTQPQICFARESQIEMIAKELDLDPVEMRRKNARAGGDVTPSGFKLGTFGFLDGLDRVIEASGWREKYGKLPRGRGIGMAGSGMISGARLMSHSASSAQIKIREDGTVALMTGSADIGQGADTVLSMIAAEVLGVRVDDVTYAMIDSDVTPLDPGAFSSRVTLWTGNAVKQAAEDARKQLEEVAAQKLKADPKHLVFRDRRVYVRHDPQRGMDFASLVRSTQNRLGHPVMGQGSYTSGDEPIAVQGGYGNASPAYSASVVVVEVEVDEETGHVTLAGIWNASDCGFPLNPMAVAGQSMGAFTMSMGQALYENLIRIEGQVMNPSFRDYKMPLIVDLPKVENVHLFDIITNDPNGPFGAKEAGQGPGDGVIAALANAIYNATGVRVKSLPISPSKILSGLEESRSNKP